MCGRFYIKTAQKQLEEELGRICRFKIEKNLNVSPGQFHPILTDKPSDELVFSYWGLIPRWAKDQKIARNTFNARIETVDQKPSFKESFQKRRCAVPVNGYFEWKKEGKRKVPYVFRKPKQEIMLFAGLWNRWESIDGFYLHSFTVITTEAISDLREIHSRMPVILSKNDLGIWLKDGCYSSLEYPDTEGLEAAPVDFKEFSHLAPRSGPPSLF